MCSRPLWASTPGAVIFDMAVVHMCICCTHGGQIDSKSVLSGPNIDCFAIEQQIDLSEHRYFLHMFSFSRSPLTTCTYVNNGDEWP